MPPKKKAAKAPKPVAKSFEDASEELDEITKVLEKGGLPLEELVSNFERGQELMLYCLRTLNSARKRLDLLEANLHAESAEEPDDPEELIPGLDDDPDDDVRLF